MSITSGEKCQSIMMTRASSQIIFIRFENSHDIRGQIILNHLRCCHESCFCDRESASSDDRRSLLSRRTSANASSAEHAGLPEHLLRRLLIGRTVTLADVLLLEHLEFVFDLGGEELRPFAQLAFLHRVRLRRLQQVLQLQRTGDAARITRTHTRGSWITRISGTGGRRTKI